MKIKRLIILVIVLTLLGAVSIYASDLSKYYRGKSVDLYVNGEKENTQAMLLEIDNEGKAMIPLRAVATTLNAMVDWVSEKQTAYIYKPNVHVLLSTMNRDGSFGTFGKVTQGKRYSFVILTQIDSLETDISGLKFNIIDPTGKVIYDYEKEITESIGSTYWTRTKEITHEFKEKGDYKVEVFMKLDQNSSYDLVSEKVFLSESN